MSTLAADGGAKPGPAPALGLRAARATNAAELSARLALGGAFLSAVASRFGLWDGALDLEHFARFQRYAAQVNSFLPASTHAFFAWAATAAELSLGLALLAGVRLREVALASAALLALFGVAMAISLGPKEPLDYSVFSASAAALLLARGRATRSSLERTRRDRLAEGGALEMCHPRGTHDLDVRGRSPRAAPLMI